MLIVIIAILCIVWVVHDFKKAGAEITNEHSIIAIFNNTAQLFNF